MRNNKNQTFFLVLLNVTLIAGFLYIFFNGGLEKVFNGDTNKYRPTDSYITSSDRVISSVKDFPHQSMTIHSKSKSTGDQSQDDNSIPASTNLESLHKGQNQLRNGKRNFSSSSEAVDLINSDEKQTLSGISSGTAIYAAERKAGAAVVSEGTYSGSMPFSDGISNLPRSSAPKVGAGNTILIDPQTDPEERKRIPVGEGLGIMLLFAAAFVGRVFYRSKVL